jgi:calcium-dependent protein kinase
MYCLVQEVVTGGELFDAIIAEGRFAENKAQMLIKRLVGVMNYSHQKGIVHRDLKPENILLEPDMNLDNMKIIDFGTAVPFKINTKKALKEVLGTPFYIAPEVLKGHYTEKCDLWSIGVITFMLLSGKAPFFGKDDHAIFDSVKKGRFEFPAAQWKSVSRQGKDFITKLLTVDYKKRPSAQQALAHPWLSDIKDTVDNHEAADVLTHLKDFRANEILKQAALGYMASQLVGKQEKEKLATMFKSFDKNGDGRLDKKEIQDGYKKFHHKLISDEEVD